MNSRYLVDSPVLQIHRHLIDPQPSTCSGPIDPRATGILDRPNAAGPCWTAPVSKCWMSIRGRDNEKIIFLVELHSQHGMWTYRGARSTDAALYGCDEHGHTLFGVRTLAPQHRSYVALYIVAEGQYSTKICTELLRHCPIGDVRPRELTMIGRGAQIPSALGSFPSPSSLYLVNNPRLCRACELDNRGRT